MGKCTCRFYLGSGAVGEVMSLIILTDCGWQDDMRGEYGESICRGEHTSALDMTNIIIINQISEMPAEEGIRYLELIQPRT
jgi:hypothetical protein